jgi:hypothetical protein
MSTQSIELNHDNCLELLKRYVDTGYIKGRCFTIKDGATLHRLLRVLRGMEKDEEIVPKQAYATVFKSLDLANAQGAFSLDDAAVIEKITTFLAEELVEQEQRAENTESSASNESSNEDSKIKEL